MVFIDAALYLTLFSIILVYILYKYFTKDFDYWDKRGVVSVKPIPFFGNFKDVLLLQKSIIIFITEIYEKSKEDFVGIWVFGIPNLVVRSPELIKHILVKDFSNFQDRNIASDDKAEPILSKMLLLIKSPEWKGVRTKSTPIYSSGKIKSMLPLVMECTEPMFDYIKKFDGKILEAKDLCAKFTTDVITSTAFGLQGDSFIKEDAIFRTIGKKLSGHSFVGAFRVVLYFFAPFLVKTFKIAFSDPKYTKMLCSIVADTIKKREKSDTKRNDLIDLIIELQKNGHYEGVKLDANSVAAQAIQFFMAGYETTSALMAFTLYELSLNPDIQVKLREEIIETLDKHGENYYEAITEMKYLHQVLSETLRKHPPLGFLDRICNQDYKIPNSNLVIEKGTDVFIPILGIHKDPEYYPEPELYDPERFSPENCANRKPYTFLPFGFGPRNCIGERFGLLVSKIGLMKIIANFQVLRTEETPVPIIYDPKIFTIQSVSGLPLKFESYKMSTID